MGCGTNEGLATAALCAIAALAGHIPEQGFNEESTAWLLRVSADPVLWIMAALLLASAGFLVTALTMVMRQSCLDTAAGAGVTAGATAPLRPHVSTGPRPTSPERDPDARPAVSGAVSPSASSC